MTIRKLKATFNRIFRRKEIDAALERLEYTPGQLNAVYRYPEIALLAAQIANLFDETGGINHVELNMFDASSMRHFTVTIQLKHRVTPIQANATMRAALTNILEKPEHAKDIATFTLRQLNYLEAKE